jgi:phospholipid/cholesterol/gamma-HCH transport system substrate-binding protein
MKRPNEFKTGLLVLGGFAIFIFANIVIRGISISQEGYTVYIRFSNISGIRPGSDVRLADGIRIGKVIDLRIEQDMTVVETIITKETELTTGSRGSVTSTTFLSELFVSITPGIGLGDRLKGGETIEGDSPMSMVDGIREFGLLMRNLNALVSTTGEDSIIRDITGVVHNAAVNVERMLHSSAGDLTATFASLRAIAAKIDLLTAEFRGSGVKTQTLLNSLNTQLPAILLNLKTASANLARITEMTTSGQNSVSLLLTDRKLYTDLTIIVENLKILSARLRNDPSILLWRDGR